MIRRHLCLALLCALVSALPARADDAGLLLDRLSTLETLQGAFIQRQYPEGSDQALTTRGHFKLLRPGYFAWEIESPDSQLILATPEYLWHHDRDLETVTRRPVASGAMSPLQVLGGDESALREGYRVEALEGEDEGDFRLTPAAAEAGFRSLVVRFEGVDIKGLGIVDNLGQRVEVGFAEVRRNAPLAPRDFGFSPPAGADLFYYDQ
ncbi:LolA family protein [Parahaliea mediterranea]|uniref:Outer-membrane lipoprotein carrier protein LolA n=1 Tax=Parahaliea mediterranea TaxID=651086 RepID=A0A939DHG2_9GAMM|nr:outer-membrane lipoprotein carrier protein LolA [Parahaliea mediterranea]MBN7797547.1 outer-membrane lipoprotein carrier protein LolA [Parahaliea mediterranea]